MRLKKTTLLLSLLLSVIYVSSSAQNSCDNLNTRIKVPLGDKINTSSEVECYKVYVPTKWGGILTIRTTKGTIADLKYPDGSAFTNGTEVGENKHGWFTFKVTGATKEYEVSNTFVQGGISKHIPWNFWYFPMNSADTRRLLFDVTPVGAMKKYDKIVGGTAAYDWEVAPANGHKDPANVGGWWGHCGGAASASILYEQPNSPPVNPHGINEEEIEGLLSEVGRSCTYSKLEGNWPGVKPVNGADATDQYVDNFHRRIRDFIRKRKKPLLLDLRRNDGLAPNEVWNQAVYKYQAIFKEDPTGGGNEKIILINNTFTSNEDFLDPNNKSGISTADPETGRKREQITDYKLKYKNNGAISQGYSDQDWKTMKLGATDLYIPKWIYDSNFPILRGTHGNPNVSETQMIQKLGVKRVKY